MKLYLDTANIDEIKYYNSTLNIEGVTTNPTIICKETPKTIEEVLNPILEILNDKQLLFVEVISNDKDSIINEAKQIIKLGKNVVPKIPVSIEGLAAIKQLSSEGINVLATAVMQGSQAYLAAINGAKYIAPYYNRMSTYDDGLKQINLMQRIIDLNNLDCEIVGAGFHNVKQVEEALVVGVKSLTVTPKILKEMYDHEGTRNAIKTFEENWEGNFQRKTLFR